MATSGERPPLGRPRKGPNKKRMVVMNVRMTQQLYRRAQQFAETYGVPMSYIVRAGLANYISGGTRRLICVDDTGDGAEDEDGESEDEAKVRRNDPLRLPALTKDVMSKLDQPVRQPMPNPANPDEGIGADIDVQLREMMARIGRNVNE